LTERRTRLVKLPRAEVDFLLVRARHLIDVVPTLERRVYNLTARGAVGFIDGPTTRYSIGPKIPWPNLRLLLGLSAEGGIGAVEPEGGLLAVLAQAFVERLEEVTRAGPVAGYGERQAVSPFLRGKLRTAEQMRDTATRAFPDRFHIDEPVFELHTPWNRVPKATASALLRHNLPPTLRHRIEAAILPLAVPDEPATEADFAAALAEPRAAGYRPLLEVCRLVLHGLTAAEPLGTGTGAFLIDLGRAFERYLTVGIERVVVPRPRWRIDAQPAFAIGPTELRPDILVRKDEAPWAVLDAKWKTATLDPNDLHQVLAYATLTGAARVGLVYPGSSDNRTHFYTPDGRIRVSVYRLRVVGTEEQLFRSVKRLIRSVRKN
jgi:5-methylcytosine-specific restriction enzyme subunit McrC